MYSYFGEEKQNTKYGLLSITCFKEFKNMWLKRLHSINKISQKTVSSSYHMEQKKFIEVSYNDNIYTRDKVFCSCCI